MINEKTATIVTDQRKIKDSSLVLNKGVLLVLSSNFFGKTFVIDKNVVTIGRSENCDFVLNDIMVSKEHCKISYEEKRFFIEDLESKNGTFLNDKQLKKKTQLFYGDKIIIGETIFRFYLEEEFVKK